MKNYLYTFALLTFITIAVGACSVQKNTSNSVENTSTNPVSTPAENVAANSESSAGAATTQNDEIKKVDFKNFTYEPYCADEEPEKITVKKGEYSRDKEDDKLYFNVMKIAYGDVNGDGASDAVILTVCNGGGTGQFSEGFVYTMKSGKPTLLTRIEGGDRADGGLRDAKVENGLLAVERNDADESSGACCPEFSVTTKYKWNGKELVEAGKSGRRELYPKTRLSFAKGATESVTKVQVSDIKRFVIGAKAGQTLIATVNTKSVSLNLNSDDADVKSEDNKFTATLNKDGDYVIELQNQTEKPTDVTLTVEIK